MSLDRPDHKIVDRTKIRDGAVANRPTHVALAVTAEGRRDILGCVYTAIMSLDPTGKGQARWTMRWKTALNAFDITFDGRLSSVRQ
ncbi:transposase [Streptomyces laculatispora]|nr:transposase [Streptomyces laculatispora]MBO0917619.1 transposase [Streptomyces laculatispora]